MKFPLRKGILTIFAGLLLTTMAACAKPAPPVTYYSLSPLTVRSSPDTPVAVPALTVGVGPVRFPESLTRGQIAQRIDDQRLKYAEYHRWSGSLAEDFARVLLEDLSHQLGDAVQIGAFPWAKYFHPSRRVLVDVRRFDGSLGGEVVLDVRWTLTDGEGAAKLDGRRAVIKVPVPGPDFSDLVSAQSRAVELLSREIAEALRS